MTARVLNFPQTPAGRGLLRDSIRLSGGSWDFPDGSRADDIDWDQMAALVEETSAAYDRCSAEWEAR